MKFLVSSHFVAVFVVVVATFFLVVDVSGEAGVEEEDDGDTSSTGWRGWKRYMSTIPIVSSIWSHSGERFFGGGDDKEGSSGQDKPNYLYSAGSIRKLARMEGSVYAAVKAYGDDIEEKLKLVKLYLADYEASSVNMLMSEDVTTQAERDYAVVANPIIAHRLIRRFAMDIPALRIAAEEEEEYDFVDALNAANVNGMIYPSVTEDYNQSLFSLLRIQKYTNLDTWQMANGTLEHLETGVGLDFRHAYDLGSYAAVQTPPNYALAVEWLEVALEKLNEEEDDYNEYRQLIEDELKQVVVRHDALCSTKEWTNEMEMCFSYLIREAYGRKRPKAGSIGRVKAAIKNQAQSATFRNRTEYSGHTRRNFLSTCSGNNLQSESDKARLFCWYETRKNAYLRIAPFKVELLSDAPYIIQIYDILGPTRIETLIKLATPTLTRSRVVNTKDPKLNDLSDVRTSQQTWIYDDDAVHAAFLDGLSRQIEYITGLNVRSTAPGSRTSEAYQVASYRTSHHYDEHLDALLDERRIAADGDRIATFMFYLTDVDVGGKTGFPVAGIAAHPIRGSGVFWHNILRNGTPDRRTWHGGCPVVHGVKWVTNKWILEKQNFNKHLCSLDPNE
ncbi:prolyl 4-hydroxylase subunit alpha-2 [Folsomia candida]|uniref:prolyl 4-hydroxylase subunit alpha-2 n=1 Tax=Folsomia candida TaxID=158441 RepID=UPI000B8F71B8|nr:prolyl 4-hydroxylase subunit alpha-2 [Folsomia candida]XP_035707381.1 prolyl 4-hydroxylase subunit alpha-2 [Folsomia candida]